MKGFIGQKSSAALADLPISSDRVTWFVRDTDDVACLKFSNGTIIEIGENSTQFVALLARVLNLENHEIKIAYFETINISAATAGTIIPPAQASISLDEFKFAEDAVLSTLSGSGQPNFESPVIGTTPIGVTLDGNGNWTVTGNYAQPIALIYVLKIKLLDFANLDQTKYLPLDETSFYKENFITPGTTAQYYRGDKTWQNLGAAIDAYLNNTSGSVSTTDATTATCEIIPVPTDTTYLVTTEILCRKISGAGVGAAGSTNTYTRKVRVKNVGGVLTLGVINSVDTSEDIAAFNATFDINGTDLRVRVTGSANNNVNWVSKTTKSII